MSFIRKIKKGDGIYLAEVKNEWINGKCVQKHIRYVGKEVDGKQILTSSISNIEVNQVKVYGPLLILNHLASEIGLHSLLGKYYSEILSLVYAHCLDYRSLNKMQDWFKQTDLNLMLPINDLTEEKLLASLDYLEQNDIEKLQQSIFSNVKKKYKLRNSGLVYDVTNTYLYGKKCPLGKLGHDKTGSKGRPLIQIALGVTKKEGIPLFHKTFHGNIHDSRTLQDIITMLADAKIKSKCIVFDRGVTSENSIITLKKLNWDVICGIAIRKGLKKTLTNLKKKNSFINYENRVRLNNNIFYVITLPYKIDNIKGMLAFCYNERLKSRIRESRYDELTYAQKLLESSKPIKDGLKKYFTKTKKIKKECIAAAEEYDGFSCIFSTKKIKKEELIKLYLGEKDIVEKAFQTIKGVIRLQPIRHWLYNRVIAHIFICYLAYLLFSLLKYRLRKLNMSPFKALKEIETMYKVYMREKDKGISFWRTVALSKAQELILKTIDKKLLKNSSV